jgi:two-component system nitrate/nitrite response regulator NarL
MTTPLTEWTTPTDQVDGGHGVSGERIVDVLVVEDHPLYRFALETVLATHPQLRLAASAASAREGLSAARTTRPQVALLDLGLPDEDGLASVTALVDSGVKVLILSGDDRPETVYGAIAAGASGYLVKDVDGDALCHAILAAARGETVVPRRLQASLAAEIQRRTATAAPLLTQREVQALQLAAERRSTREIATELHVSPSTVKAHFASVHEKLGVSTRADALLEGVRRGLVSLSAPSEL